MPNWCYSWVNITGDEKELNVLDKHFENARKHIGTKNGFGETWLGNIVEYLGMDATKVSCRGSIVHYEHHPEEICLSTETAWAPLLTPIVMLCEKYAPNAEITYTSEEPGCGLFVSNDPDYVDKFVLDIWDDEINDYTREPLTKDEVKEWLEDILHKKDGYGNLMEEAMNKYEFCVNHYEYCDVHEL